jgi:hypothetical protein
MSELRERMYQAAGVPRRWLTCDEPAIPVNGDPGARLRRGGATEERAKN